MYDIFDGFDEEEEFFSEDDKKLFDNEVKESNEAEEQEHSSPEAEDLHSRLKDIEAIEMAFDVDEDFDWPVTPTTFVERHRKDSSHRHHKCADVEEDCKNSDILLRSSFNSRADFADAVVDVIKDMLDSERVYDVETHIQRGCSCMEFDIELQNHKIDAVIVVDVEENAYCSLMFKPQTVRVSGHEDALRAILENLNYRRVYGRFFVSPADGCILADQTICIEHGFSRGNLWATWDEIVNSLSKLIEEYDRLCSGRTRRGEKKILSII